MDIVLILGVGAVIGAVALLWWSLRNRPSPASANLFAGLPTARSEARRSADHDVLRRAGDVVRRVAPASLVTSLETKLVQAGHPLGLDLAHLLGIKVVVGVGTLLLGLLAGNPLMAVAAGGLGFFMPDVWLGMQRDKRKEAMRLAAADMIDQLTICVEAGLGFDAALARVAGANDGPLAHELSHTIRDMRAGVPRPQALRGLADRSDVPEIRQVVLALLQAPEARHPDRRRPPHPSVRDANQAPPADRGEGGQDAGEDHLPDLALHDAGDVHRHPRTGCDQDHPIALEERAEPD